MNLDLAPNVECEQQHAALSVEDVAVSVDFYVNKLGFRVAFEEGAPPTFAGVNLDCVQIFLAKGTPSPESCSIYFVVDDADSLFEFQRGHGVAVVEAPGDRTYGLRDYTIRDRDGYCLKFGHRIPTSTPPLKIERVDVPVRMEKRLAALLRDLAAHKRMSVDSCLEELLLHTCEPFGLTEGLKALERGDGVPSPHTRRTLEHIQELKQKHGIDYDCHASYRFVEGK